jgi:hypothetical protein
MGIGIFSSKTAEQNIVVVTRSTLIGLSLQTGSRSASDDSPVALDSLEEVFYSMTTPVKLCGEWDSRRAVGATRNAGFNSLSARCLSEGGAVIGFVADKGRILRQALRELFCKRDVGLVPT